MKTIDESIKSQADVPPGQGKASTRARNQRKRLRKKHLKLAAQDVKEATGLTRPQAAKIPSNIAPTILDQNEPAAPVGNVQDPSVSMSISPVLPDASVQANTRSIPLTSTPAPMSESSQGDLKMLSLASGNSKKAKSIRRDLLNGRRQTNKKIVYGDGEAVSTSITPDNSGILVDASAVSAELSLQDVPQANGSRASVSRPGKEKQQKPENFFPSEGNKRPPPPPPSTRSDLPPNVIVTSVDVEADDFVPGVPTAGFVAPLQVPYYAPAQSKTRKAAHSDQNAADKAAAAASEYFNAYSGYYGSLGKDTKSNKKNKKNGVVNGETTPANVEKYVKKLDANGWPGWPSAGELEGGLFEKYTKVTAPGDGEKVAVKVSGQPSDPTRSFTDFVYLGLGTLAIFFHAITIFVLWNRAFAWFVTS